MHNQMYIPEITRKGNGKMAHEAIKIDMENAANGIQFNVSTGYCHAFINIYTPIAAKPTAVPIVDAVYKN